MQKPRSRAAATGGALAVVVFVLVALIRTGLDSGIGFGAIGDSVFVIGLFLATTTVFGATAWVGLTVVRRLPARITVLIAGSVATGILFLKPQDDVRLRIIVLLAGIGLSAWLGGTMGRLWQVARDRRRGGAEGRVQIRAAIHAAVALSACLAVSTSLLLSPASARRGGAGAGQTRAGDGAPLRPADPAARGPYVVESFTYGSGSDRRRAAYRDEVVLTTLSQDLRPLMPEFRGLEAWLHRSRWGFGLEAVPLNATVWMPSGEGPFPVVLFIHGIDPTSERSELGYAYLGEVLASRGYVVVAADMNFLGGPHIARAAGEMPVRAWLALKHLDLLKEWQELHPGSRADRMDFDRIVVGGHSRGGEAAVLAVTLNAMRRYPHNASIAVAFGHSIRGVFALAPTDRLYPLAGQATRLTDISYLAIHGSHDIDVPSFMGLAQYQRISISAGSSAFKASIYVAGANHAHFNSQRNGRDLVGISGLLLDPSEVLSGADQRRLTSVFVSAFADAVLLEDQRSRAILQDMNNASSLLPSTQYLSRFEDGWTRTLASFEEDADPFTATLPGVTIESRPGTIWREEPLTLRGVDEPSPYTQVARVQWNRDAANGSDPSWEVRLPAHLATELAGTSAQLRFAMFRQPHASDLPEVSVELETFDGVRARLDAARFAPDPPREKPRFWRVPGLDALISREPEAILQDVVIPLTAVQAIEPAFDPAGIQTIRFVFDRTPTGSVLLDDIGFRVAPPALPVDGQALGGDRVVRAGPEPAAHIGPRGAPSAETGLIPRPGN